MSQVFDRSKTYISKIYQDFVQTGVIRVEDTWTGQTQREPFTWFQIKSMFRKVAKELKRPMIYVRTSSYHPWEQASPHSGYKKNTDKVIMSKEIYIQRRGRADELVGLLLLAAETLPAATISKTKYNTAWMFRFSGDAMKIVDEWLRYVETDPVARQILKAA